MITLRNKIGQMLIMGFHGCDINEQSNVAQWLSGDGLGGVLLFDIDLVTGTYGKNLKNPSQIKQLVSQLNHFSSSEARANEQVALLIAIDYEGGSVDRLARLESCMPTLSARDLTQLSEAELNEELTQMAFTLKSLGFNLNFAPVVDLHLQDHQGIIGALGRSFSQDPEVVIRMAQSFVNVFSRYGIVCSYKHFPGHGSAVGDTHSGFVDVTDTYKSDELEPYYQLAKDSSKPVMIMTAHVVNRHLDDQGLPATLSKKMLDGLLRTTMEYDGVIVSDDLQMQAISDHYSLEESLCLTINAGADMMIFANQLGSNTAPEIIDCIEQLVLQQRIDPLRIDDAYRRVMRLKQQINRENSYSTKCITS